MTARPRADRPVVAALVVGMATIAAACSTGGDPFDFAVKKVPIELAFSEEELAEPVAPERIIRIVPAPPQVQQPVDLEPFRRAPDAPPPPPEIPSFLPDCPVAPEGAAPKEVVAFEVRNPPAVGRYPRHNEGVINITGGPFPLAFPFPPWSRWEIPAIEQVEQPDALGGEPTVNTEWNVEKIFTDTIKTVDRYRLTDTNIQLLSRTTVNGEESQVFTPSPPIEFYRFGVEDTEWTSAGTDLEAGTAMLFQARIERREVIDVCGEVFDTYRFAASETVVNLNTGETSGTQEGDPNIYNIATHLGGLIVREDIHITQNTRDPESGVPLILEFDYVSVLDTVVPEEIGT